MKKIFNDASGIKFAIDLANQNPVEKFKVASFIVNKKGHVVSVGYNSITKTHPLQAKYATMSNRPMKVYLHAEIGALVKCRDSAPDTLYVARVWKDGTPSLAKPCKLCSLAIKESGVKRVVYSLNENEYAVYEVNNYDT